MIRTFINWLMKGKRIRDRLKIIKELRSGEKPAEQPQGV